MSSNRRYCNRLISTNYALMCWLNICMLHVHISHSVINAYLYACVRIDIIYAIYSSWLSSIKYGNFVMCLSFHVSIFVDEISSSQVTRGPQYNLSYYFILFVRINGRLVFLCAISGVWTVISCPKQNHQTSKLNIKNSNKWVKAFCRWKWFEL